MDLTSFFENLTFMTYCKLFHNMANQNGNPIIPKLELILLMDLLTLGVGFIEARSALE